VAYFASASGLLRPVPPGRVAMCWAKGGTQSDRLTWLWRISSAGIGTILETQKQIQLLAIVHAGHMMEKGNVSLL